MPLTEQIVNMHRALKSRPGRRAESGVALLEAMVGILIFAFGVLGVVGLQASMSKAQGNAKYRTEAANLGNELLGKMWADTAANLPSYGTDACKAHAPCADWLGKLERALPLGKAELSWDAANQEVHIEIFWTRPGEGSSRFDMRAVIS